ncbi:MAG: cytochrome c family protein [Rickettsiales bacterium]|nr:cytochrome c family protein [Rickettsiales bacterium]RPG13032.1 MAG: cytochrome c family protein [Pelagibacteraceae bacterium TMED195]|tara:strand:- start:3953 stop:4345 length:393 start_codon:yes stop_codon:yes gene_type:complete
MINRSFIITLLGFFLISLSANAGDAEKGKKVFKKCAACHNVASGAKHKTGPNLWNIVGAKAGIQDGYKYSDWLKGAGIEWNDENLAAWVGKKKEKTAKFGKDVKKSKMIFAGLRKKEQVADLIAYLKTLK